MVHKEFRWCWHHVPTFEPYRVEGIFFPLILTSGHASQTMRTALTVLQSLTPNAQSVFKILAQYQIAHPKDEGNLSLSLSLSLSYISSLMIILSPCLYLCFGLSFLSSSSAMVAIIIIIIFLMVNQGCQGIPCMQCAGRSF